MKDYSLFTLLAFWCCWASMPAQAQDTEPTAYYFTLLDEETREPLIGATIRYQLHPSDPLRGAITDAKGQAKIHLKAAKYSFTFSYVGYQTQRLNLKLVSNKYFQIQLKPDNTILQEVVVTASESKGITSASRIDTQAMSHLQPSSFSDLTALLPGGLSADPALGVANTLRIREASQASELGFSSLGTSFVVDGVPLDTDANLQTISATRPEHDKRDITSRGVDMRTLSTDNIESVEVIRGIPSVRYGDVSTGVVRIKRKEQASPLEFRFKADLKSKLFYVGKGLRLSEHYLLNLNLDYLDSKVDPRNRFENFKRITASTRLKASYPLSQGQLIWQSSLDYTGTLDRVKRDPEASELNDRYKSSNRSVALRSSLRYITAYDWGLRNLSLTPSVRAQFDKVEQTRDVYLNMPTAIPNSSETGSADAIYLPNHYISELTIDGKPLNAFVQLNSQWAFQSRGLRHLIDAGAEYSYSKNKGRGQIYDVNRPPSPTMTTRPRSFRAIPALQKASVYLEDKLSLQLTAQHQLELEAGVRGITLLGMDKEYALQHKIYWDPRINLLFDVINTPLAADRLVWRLGAGWGILSKFPTLAQLYPDKRYYDLEELNYYHPNPAYRRLVLYTQVYEKNSHALKANRNRKWEIRTELSWNKYRLSLTYFQEQSKSGFRSLTEPLRIHYRKYDTSGLDPHTLTDKPQLEDLPVSPEVYFVAATNMSNGYGLNKEGVEFQLNTPRYPKLHTRLTLTGAWFKTTHRDQLSEWYNPGIVLDGKQLPYMARYHWNERKEFQSFNSSLMFDTYLPKLGLSFSTTIQSQWMSLTKIAPRNHIPIEYMDKEGAIHPYTEADQTDPELQWLMLRESSSSNSCIPHAFLVNFKANKNFGKRMNLSLFVNKIMSYTPSYTRHDIRIHRSVSPYFGMELNFKI